MKNPVTANWIGVSPESGVNCRAFLRFVVAANLVGTWRRV
jgi:hypothetical protein